MFVDILSKHASRVKDISILLSPKEVSMNLRQSYADEQCQ